MKNRFHLKDGHWAIIIFLALTIIDQIIKIQVKTNMTLGESLHITDWFYISFVENNGMAYGLTFFNKLVLSLFRIVAVSFIGYYIYRVVRKPDHRTSYVICLSVIIAGAMGNIIDSMFYGLIFDSSTPFSVSQLVPFGEGYSSFLQGKVVDMFYFPLIVTTWPEWVPIWGGNEFIFFSHVFNFADACISCGIVCLFLFFRKDLEDIGDVFKRKSNEL
jgi:signal peptidase II